jgi:ubiquinone/menaquinone biosynthesis C-methylase UbiE
MSRRPGVNLAKIRNLASRIFQSKSSSRPSRYDDASQSDGRPAGADTADNANAVAIITDLDELDKKLNEVTEAWKVSDEAMRSVFSTFEMTYPSDMPSDPYSDEYSDRVFDYYRAISGRDRYEVNNEHMEFPMDPNRPFPFYTESPQIVGHQMMGIGFIITVLNLPSGSSVLDLGAGWGNTSIALARMGYDVMAVDVNEPFAKFIRERAEKLSLDVASVTGTFLEIDRLGRTFDAVLFFESFHHCSDHIQLIAKLSDVLKTDGKVFFAAEPITDAFPVPWGIRMDGESLWAIRQNGWLELGFQESYFLRTLLRFGWVAIRHVNTMSHLASVLEATRANGHYAMGTFDLPSDEERSWAPSDGAGVRRRFCTDASRITIETSGDYESIVVRVTNFAPRELSFLLTHGRQKGAGTVAADSESEICVPYDPEATCLEIRSDTWRPSELLGTSDEREIGLSVESISLVHSGHL